MSKNSYGTNTDAVAVNPHLSNPLSIPGVRFLVSRLHASLICEFLRTAPARLPHLAIQAADPPVATLTGTAFAQKH